MYFSDEMRRGLYSVLTFARSNKHSFFYKNLPLLKERELPESFSSLPVHTAADMKKHQGELSHYEEREVRYLSSEFKAENSDRLFLVPQQRTTTWSLLDAWLGKGKATSALLSIPLFWQIGPVFYQTCKKKGVPVTAISPRNLPLARQIIKEAAMDFVVTTPPIAAELFSLLAEEGLGEQIRTWHLIVPLGERPSLPILSGSVYVEWHVFPGVPVGYAPVASFKTGGFTPLPSYFFETHKNKLLISSLTKEALPLLRFSPGVDDSWFPAEKGPTQSNPGNDLSG